MALKKKKITTIGTLAGVKRVKKTGKYRITLEQCSPGNAWYAFDISKERALKIADAEERFPLTSRVKVTGRELDNLTCNLGYVNILAVDGVEITAWSQRAGSTQVDIGVISAAQRRIEEAKAAEEAMVNRAPPAQPGEITDPVTAYENAMRIVRRQRRLKNPKLSQQEIWQVRDALNLLAEKLGIA